MFRSSRNALIAIILLVLILAACASQSFPHGTFAPQFGPYRVTFKDDGSFVFTEGGVVASQGAYSIQGNELTWETDSHCAAQGAEVATYTWSFDNNQLVLKVKGTDDCADRAPLYSVPWHLQQ